MPEERIAQLENRIQELETALAGFRNLSQMDPLIRANFDALFAFYVANTMVVGDISNVTISSPSANEVLKIASVSGSDVQWENNTDAVA